MSLKKILLISILLIVNILSIDFIKKNSSSKLPHKIFSESAEIKKVEKLSTFNDLSKYFIKLAEDYGGEQAFKFLLTAPVPKDIDLHLLAHGVGDILYEQQGVEGIKICTQDFRNACSHSIVVGHFLQKGMDALQEVVDVCKKAPGGKGAYAMCFHGLGHGVLAYAGYNLEKAIDICKKTETDTSTEMEECVGGAIMELTTGGAHDWDKWKIAKTKYFKIADPLYPCTATYMPEKAKRVCLAYITPHLWEAAGGSLGNPESKIFEKSFTYCNKISRKEVILRQSCYGGFGKEFIVLAKGRDIRDVASLTEGGMKQVYSWCALAKNETDIDYCNQFAINSLYWGGENDVSGAVRYCTLIPNENLKKSCIKNLTKAVFYYKQDAERKIYCDLLPQNYQNLCVESN